MCLVDLGRLCALLFWRGFRVSLLLRVGLFCCSRSCFVDCVCFSLYCVLVCVVIGCCVLAFVWGGLRCLCCYLAVVVVAFGLVDLL